MYISLVINVYVKTYAYVYMICVYIYVYTKKHVQMVVEICVSRES